MGEFHGYDACHYVIRWIRYNKKHKRDSRNKKKLRAKIIHLKLQSLTQLKCVYYTDKALKRFLLPLIQQLVTTLKYCVYLVITYGSHCISINSVADFCLIPKANIKKSLNYNLKLSRATLITGHNYSKKQDVPFYVALDLMNFYPFIEIISNLLPNLKNLLAFTTHIPTKILVQQLILLKDLRNSIAHNDMIFDCRFRGNYGVSKVVTNALHKKYAIPNINFNHISDYFILITYIQQKMSININSIFKELKTFENIIKYFKHIENNVTFEQVFDADGLSKLKKLHLYLKKSLLSTNNLLS